MPQVRHIYAFLGSLGDGFGHCVLRMAVGLFSIQVFRSIGSVLHFAWDFIPFFFPAAQEKPELSTYVSIGEN